MNASWPADWRYLKISFKKSIDRAAGLWFGRLYKVTGREGKLTTGEKNGWFVLALLFGVSFP